MTVTFFSNFLTLHQTAFCSAMVKKLGDNFKFVATEKTDAERLAMGYENLNEKMNYVIKSYESNESYSESLRLGRESDVVIIGSAPDKFITERLDAGKVTFRYSERFFKQGNWRILDPRVLRHRFNHDYRYRNKPLYMLCASAYTAPDCRFIFSYPGKTYKWGYFPEVKKYEEDKLISGKHISGTNRMEILWVGRQIEWKQPKMAVLLASYLKDKGAGFHLTMIGEGPKRKALMEIAKRMRLNEFITFLNFMPQEEVRAHMEKANVFLFTSNREEGWGAVLNESMNSGCAIIANDEIGSVPFLIENGKNGLTYHKSFNDLCRAMDVIIDNPSKTDQLGIEAYRTMRTLWNAEAATGRLLTLFESLLTGKELPQYPNGPISRC